MDEEYTYWLEYAYDFIARHKHNCIYFKTPYFTIDLKRRSG